jgi:hypothetical protein
MALLLFSNSFCGLSRIDGLQDSLWHAASGLVSKIVAAMLIFFSAITQGANLIATNFHFLCKALVFIDFK